MTLKPLLRFVLTTTGFPYLPPRRRGAHEFRYESSRTRCDSGAWSAHTNANFDLRLSVNKRGPRRWDLTLVRIHTAYIHSSPYILMKTHPFPTHLSFDCRCWPETGFSSIENESQLSFEDVMLLLYKARLAGVCVYIYIM